MQASIDWNREAESTARDVGMARAALANLPLVLKAREYAKRLGAAREDRLVNADDVRLAMEAAGERVTWGNWAGSIFKEPHLWEDAGVTRCSHKQGHRRRITIWRMK